MENILLQNSPFDDLIIPDTQINSSVACFESSNDIGLIKEVQDLVKKHKEGCKIPDPGCGMAKWRKLVIRIVGTHLLNKLFVYYNSVFLKGFVIIHIFILI